MDEVNALISNKEFGIITTCIDSLIDETVLEENYYSCDTYAIKTDTNGIYEVTVWLPRESKP